MLGGEGYIFFFIGCGDGGGVLALQKSVVGLLLIKNVILSIRSN